MCIITVSYTHLPSFYNIRQLAEKQNLSYNKLQNTEESGSQETGFIQGVADMWSEWRNLDAASICKTAGANLYSDALGNSAAVSYTHLDVYKRQE